MNQLIVWKYSLLVYFYPPNFIIFVSDCVCQIMLKRREKEENKYGEIAIHSITVRNTIRIVHGHEWVRKVSVINDGGQTSVDCTSTPQVARASLTKESYLLLSKNITHSEVNILVSRVLLQLLYFFDKKNVPSAGHCDDRFFDDGQGMERWANLPITTYKFDEKYVTPTTNVSCLKLNSCEYFKSP